LNNLTVILVAYHSAHHLAESLPILRNIDHGVPREIIVVNNSPEEDLADICREHEAKLLVPGGNLGFGRGVNYGFRESSGDVILVCNPDAIPKEGALKGSYDFLVRNDNVGIVCPKLIYPDGTMQESVRRFYDWRSALYARSPLRNDKNPPEYFRRYMMLDEDFSSTCEIDWALGAVMFIRRELADKMDGKIFDPRYFLYFEDVDLCYTCWRLGYKVMYLPESVFVHHYERKSKKNPLSKANMHHLVSFVKFLFKHHGLPPRPEVEGR
jgi:hypothetical protein